MAVRFGFRPAIKRPTRGWRRIEVICFLLVVFTGVCWSGAPWRWKDFPGPALPFFVALSLLFSITSSSWKIRRVRVSSLDELADWEYGVEFDTLTEAQRRDVLRRFRVGTYLLSYLPDELDKAREAEANLRAYRILRRTLLPLALVYWLGWLSIPTGRLRAAWTDAPALFAWAAILVLALPHIIRMWTEPDDPSEPKIAAEEKP